MPVINFITAAPDTPEGKIVQTMRAAMQFISESDFTQACLTNILANITFTDPQRLAIKFASRGFTGLQSLEGINNLLQCVYYGTFDTIGVSESEVDALTSEQREAIVQQIYLTAKSIVDAKATELGDLAAWTYTTPDWVPTPPPEPDPE